MAMVAADVPLRTSLDAHSMALSMALSVAPSIALCKKHVSDYLNVEVRKNFATVAEPLQSNL
jgi:hypothetical protein